MTADDQTKIYGQANPTLTGTLAGVQNGDNITASYATSADTGSGVGNYPISATLVDPDGKLANYTAATNNALLTVTPALLTVTADDKSKVSGENNPALTASFTGFVNGDTQGSALSGSPAITTTADTTSPAGSYPITIAIGSLTAANYTFGFVDGTLIVSPAQVVAPPGALTSQVNNGIATITFLGTPGAHYAIQATAALGGSWDVLDTVTADENGIVTFTDPAAGTFASRFYRAALP